eukprot:589002-Alexandrium_andersonii.AAC.1
MSASLVGSEMCIRDSSTKLRTNSWTTDHRFPHLFHNLALWSNRSVLQRPAREVAAPARATGHTAHAAVRNLK